MPQTYDAGGFFLARAALAEGPAEALETATLLNPSQQAVMRRAMEGAHQVRRIPVGNQAFLERAGQHGGYNMSRAIDIDDERLRYLWNRFRQRAVRVVKTLAPQCRALVIADQLAAGFQTRECRALLRRFRAEYDRRRQGSDEAAAVLRRAILAHVDAQVRPPHQGRWLQELSGT